MELTAENLHSTWDECYGDNAVYIEVIATYWSKFFGDWSLTSFVAIDEKELANYIATTKFDRILEVKPVYPNRADYREFKSLPLNHQERVRLSALLNSSAE